MKKKHFIFSSLFLTTPVFADINSLKNIKPDVQASVVSNLLDLIAAPLQIALAVIGLIGIIFGLFKLVSSLGDDQKKSDVKESIKAIFYLIVGLATFGTVAFNLYSAI